MSTELSPREISADLPEEPPLHSVVLTAGGAVYQRMPRGVTHLGDDVWCGVRFLDSFGPPALTWLMLLGEGPLYQLTDDASLAWIDQHREEDAT